MIRFSRSDSLINSDFLPPAGDLNFTFKVISFVKYFKYLYSMFYV